MPTTIWLKQFHSSVTNFSAGSNQVSFPFDILYSFSSSLLLQSFRYLRPSIWWWFGSSSNFHDQGCSHAGHITAVSSRSFRLCWLRFDNAASMFVLLFSRLSYLISLWLVFLPLYLLDSAPILLPLDIVPLLSAYWFHSIVPSTSLTLSSSYHC